jgi:MFS family permease
LNLIQVQGSTTAAGAAMPRLDSPAVDPVAVSGGLVDRFGARALLVIGPAIAAGGFALFAIPGVGGSYWITFLPAVVVLGLGMSISVAPLTTTVMNSVDAGFSGAASGINNAASRVASLLAVALFGLIMTSMFNRSLHSQLEQAGCLPLQVIEAVERQRDKLGAIELPESIEAGDKASARQAIAEAFVTGFRAIMLICAALALASAASAWVLIEGEPADGTPSKRR